MTDLITEVQQKLGLGEERTGNLSLEQALPVLRQLAEDIQVRQRGIGMVLWHLDPTPGDMVKIAETLSIKVETLRSWVTTFSRLRHDAEKATLKFSMQHQLARVMNAEDREILWNSRPEKEWTLAALTQAVDLHMDSIGSSVMPRTKKAGCKASYNDRQVKVNLELAEDVVIVRTAVSGDIELENMRFEKVSKGVYQVKFDW